MAGRTRGRLVRANAVDEPDGDSVWKTEAKCGASESGAEFPDVVESGVGSVAYPSECDGMEVGENGGGALGGDGAIVGTGTETENGANNYAELNAIVHNEPGEPVCITEAEAPTSPQPSCSRTSEDATSSAPQPLIPRRFKRPPLLRARTTQLNLVKSPPSPPLELRKHYGRSMSVPATAGDDDLQPCFLNIAALPEASVQNIRTHYYPEGGWGWCVVVVAGVLHGAVAGLQAAFGTLLPTAVKEFFEVSEEVQTRMQPGMAETEQAVWQTG